MLLKPFQNVGHIVLQTLLLWFTKCGCDKSTTIWNATVHTGYKQLCSCYFMHNNFKTAAKCLIKQAGYCCPGLLNHIYMMLLKHDALCPLQKYFTRVYKG